MDCRSIGKKSMAAVTRVAYACQGGACGTPAGTEALGRKRAD